MVVKNMNTLRHFVNTLLTFWILRNPNKKETDLYWFSWYILENVPTCRSKGCIKIHCLRLWHIGIMERFGITVEDLKSGPVPSISNILNDLVLDMFKVNKIKKEWKIKDLFHWLQKFVLNLYTEQVLFQSCINWYEIKKIWREMLEKSFLIISLKLIISENRSLFV